MGTNVMELGPFVAGKAMRTNGKSYKAGDPVDVSHMEPYKVEQLLRQRLLKPEPPEAAQQ